MPNLQVKLFAYLTPYRPEARHGEPFSLPFSDGSTLGDALAVLGLPEPLVRHVFVNGERTGLAYRPRDGDEIAIFPPIAGG